MGMEEQLPPHCPELGLTPSWAMGMDMLHTLEGL